MLKKPRLRKRASWALLLVLLGIAGALKAFYNPMPGASLDGDYYFQIARHVKEGDGLTTSVSLYHQGFKTFPHRVNQNPLWLLTLGYTGRWFGMVRSAFLLPEILYILDLILFYVLANRLRESIGTTGSGWLFREGRPFNIGHVAVLLFGANSIVFRFTSLPYTEAMAFFLLFSALLLLERAARLRSLGWATGAGLLAGLAFLTRSQMLLVLPALPMALAVVGLRDRRFLGLAAVTLCASLLPVIPWAIYLSSWMESLTPATLIGLAEFQETPELTLFPHRVATDSLGAYVLDRARGLLVAFSPTHRYSYVHRFGGVAYVVLLALIHIAVTSSLGVRGRVRHLEARHVLLIAVLLTSIGLLGPVHMAHNTFFMEWLFAHRHGLPLVLLIIPALLYLDGVRRPWLVWSSAALLASTVVPYVPAMANLLGSGKNMGGLNRVEYELVKWLDGQSPRPTVVTARAQRLGAFSRSNFHWMDCDERFEQTLALLRHTGANYVLMFENEWKCRFLNRGTPELQVVDFLTHRNRSVTILSLSEPNPGIGEPRITDEDGG